MLVAGMNCWVRSGYLIGTPVLNACLNIDSSGNVSIPYNLTVSGTLYPSLTNASYTAPFDNNTGQISLHGSTGNYIGWNTNGTATPTTTTRSIGTNLILYPCITATDAEYAIGIACSQLWPSIPDMTCTFKWYCGTTPIAVVGAAGMMVNNQIYRYRTSS
jgi:hypothetical protein